jgi:hypothetical protein
MIDELVSFGSQDKQGAYEGSDVKGDDIGVSHRR